MHILTTPIMVLGTFLASLTTTTGIALAGAATKGGTANLDLSCSGSIHAEAVDLWENSLKTYFNRQIKVGLVEKGNTYVLYNTQEELQAFVEMTRRCKDRKQIGELVDTIAPSLDDLQPLPGHPEATAWICRSGPICNNVNHLLGSEVQLNSAQYLGLLGALATTVIEVIPEADRTDAEKSFISKTTNTIASQLDRWLSPAYFITVRARAHMKPSDAMDHQSKYFFLDRDLWYIDELADLSELHQDHILTDTEGARALKSLQGKSQQIAELINLFLSRITLIKTATGMRAEIDRGYWANYADSQYALYSGERSPVTCSIDAMKVQHKTFSVQKKSSYIDSNLGWDFSHARRLVPALDTLGRNKSNLETVFGYRNSALNPAKLAAGFANQITDKIWNKDSKLPLFSNFWNGSNGWYRAGYENGTAACRPGQAPYSLAWSFPTSGYTAWGRTNPQVQSLGIRLYQLLQANDAPSAAFVKRYYPTLGITNPIKSARNIWMLSVVSALVN